MKTVHLLLLQLVWHLCASIEGAVLCSGILPMIQNGEFPAVCQNSEPGTVCQAVCDQGYTSTRVPTTTCLPSGVWSSATTSSCHQAGVTSQRNRRAVCKGSPVVSSTGVSWPASCEGSIRTGAWCRGQCGKGMTGNPRVLCTSGGWSSRDVTKGSCKPDKVRCVEKPPDVLNGQWPNSCKKAEVGATCRANCKMTPTSWFNSTGTPEVTCLSSGSWSIPVDPAYCVEGPAGGINPSPSPSPVIDDGGGGAALPADIEVTATPCTSAAAGSTTAVTFDVRSVVNPEWFVDVSLQLDFPTALWPTVEVRCQDAAAQELPCNMPSFGPEELAVETLSVGCFLGSIAPGGSSNCTLIYTIPTSAAAVAAIQLNNQVMGAITYNPILVPTVADNTFNNAAATCVMA